MHPVLKTLSPLFPLIILFRLPRPPGGRVALTNPTNQDGQLHSDARCHGRYGVMLIYGLLGMILSHLVVQQPPKRHHVTMSELSSNQKRRSCVAMPTRPINLVLGVPQARQSIGMTCVIYDRRPPQAQCSRTHFVEITE